MDALVGASNWSNLLLIAMLDIITILIEVRLL
jgi:hypothetical protein